MVCTWLCKTTRKLAKGHTTIQYRSFKHLGDFLQDLNSAPFAAVFSVSDPSKALSAWYEAFLPVIEKHAQLRRKRVKHPTLPQWLSTDIIKAMKTRDKFKQEKEFEDYLKKKRKRKKKKKKEQSHKPSPSGKEGVFSKAHKPQQRYFVCVACSE